MLAWVDAMQSVAERVAALDWAGIGAALDQRGCATTGPLLTEAECDALVQGYDAGEAFRSRVVMARHGYGKGEYKYYAYPLPTLVGGLRTALYPGLAEVANRWAAALGLGAGFPSDHAAFLARCHAAGQPRPTPLLLRYGPATTTACTRTCMATCISPCRPHSCSAAPTPTLPAASSC